MNYARLSNDHPVMKTFTVYTPPPVPQLPGEKWTLITYAVREYLVSTKGRIYSFCSGRIISGKLTDGHPVFDFKANEHLPVSYHRGRVRRPKKVGMTISLVVGLAFLKRPPEARILMHLDYNQRNNAVSNLKWTTREEHAKHCMKSPKYHTSSNSKLTIKQVLRIKSMLKLKRQGKLNMFIKEIAAKFKVHEYTIQRIQNGQIWSTVGPIVKPLEPKKTAA